MLNLKPLGGSKDEQAHRQQPICELRSRLPEAQPDVARNAVRPRPTLEDVEGHDGDPAHFSGAVATSGAEVPAGD